MVKGFHIKSLIYKNNLKPYGGYMDYEVKDGKVAIQYDKDKDGKPSAELALDVSEAIAEAFKKGEQLEDVKVVGFGFEDGKLKVKLDTDKDGESSLELTVNLAELANELGLI